MTPLDDDDLAAHVADELAPLSDARLAEILAANLKPRYRDAITALLAERERLLAVVRAVVSLPPNGSLIEPIYITRETYMRARAALAAADAPGETERE